LTNSHRKVGGERGGRRLGLHCGWWGMGVYKDQIDNITKNINDSVSHQAIGPKVEPMKTYNNNVLSEPKPMTRCCHQS